MAVDPGPGGDQARPVPRLDLVEVGVVDDPGEHLPRVERHATGRCRTMPSSSSVVVRAARRRRPGRRAALAPVEPGDDPPADPERVGLVDGDVVGQAADPAVHRRPRRAPPRRRPRRSPSCTSGGPPRNTFAPPSTITTWSLMPGTYAPPAVELPNTSAIVGMPAADSRVRSRKICPPGMKISFWVGRSAPPDSTRLISGSRFSRAICIGPQRLLQRPRVAGAAADGRVVGDQHALDALDHADAGDHAGADREVAAPRGQRGQLEERAVLGRAAARSAPAPAACRAVRCRATYFSPPPASAFACSASSSASFASIASRVGGERVPAHVQARAQRRHDGVAEGWRPGR